MPRTVEEISHALLDAARKAGAEAADALDPVSAQQAISTRRLAIRALDLAIEVGSAGAGPIRERRSALIEAFIAAHPDDPAAGAYAYQRATSGEVKGAQSIESLLLVDGSEELRIAARHEAGRLLYQRFLNAPATERAVDARRFLTHAAMLLEEDRQRLVTRDDDALALALLVGLYLAPLLARLRLPVPRSRGTMPPMRGAVLRT